MEVPEGPELAAGPMALYEDVKEKGPLWGRRVRGVTVSFYSSHLLYLGTRYEIENTLTMIVPET